MSSQRAYLLAEMAQHIGQIEQDLREAGVRGLDPLAEDFLVRLTAARTNDGCPLPPNLQDMVARQHERLMLVAKQLAAIKR